MINIQQIEQPLNHIVTTIHGINLNNVKSNMNILEAKLIEALYDFERLLNSIELSEKTPIEEAQATLPRVLYLQKILVFYYKALKKEKSTEKAVLVQFLKTLDALENYEIFLGLLASEEDRKNLSDLAVGNHSNFTKHS